MRDEERLAGTRPSTRRRPTTIEAEHRTISRPLRSLHARWFSRLVERPEHHLLEHRTAGRSRARITPVAASAPSSSGTAKKPACRRGPGLVGGEGAEQHQELADEAATAPGRPTEPSTMIRNRPRRPASASRGRRTRRAGACGGARRARRSPRNSPPVEMPCAASGRSRRSTPCAFSDRMPSTQKPEVRHRRVGDQLLDVVLRERDSAP